MLVASLKLKNYLIHTHQNNYYLTLVPAKYLESSEMNVLAPAILKALKWNLFLIHKTLICNKTLFMVFRFIFSIGLIQPFDIQLHGLNNYLI